MKKLRGRPGFEGEQALQSSAAASYLDQSSHNAQAGEPEVLERSGLGDGVEERVEEERDVGCAREGGGTHITP